jgi:hypothetical protein
MKQHFGAKSLRFCLRSTLWIVASHMREGVVLPAMRVGVGAMSFDIGQKYF